MDPDTSEASAQQLALACEQGEAYGRALRHMIEDVAHDSRAATDLASVRVEPPMFLRHDEVNGCRFTGPVEAEFDPVSVRRGAD